MRTESSRRRSGERAVTVMGCPNEVECKIVRLLQSSRLATNRRHGPTLPPQSRSTLLT